MVDFKDRTNETKEIKNILNSSNFELLIIYGRRRVGKTELILNSIKDRKAIYYLATTEKNLDRFYNTCSQFDKNVNNLKKDYEVLFEYLKDKCEVIIIDEFQNLIKENENIISLLQSIVDNNLKKTKLKLILLGSSVSIISSKTLNYKSPLYGRKTASFKLKPISFFDLKYFFPNLKIEQIIDIYGFADGIPYYIIKIEENFWKWFEKELKSEKNFLRDEIDFIMRYEFDNSSTYKIILEAIANGKTKLSEIKDYSNLQRTDISPYLKNLIEVDLVKREIPITENLLSRNGRYYIKDNFIKFWFKFIYPNLSSIEAKIFDYNIIKDKYSQYLGDIYEYISKEYLIRSKIFNFTKIGKWWYKNNEIDIVALDERDKSILFGECKYKEKVDAESICKEIIDKIDKVEWNNKDRKETLAIFAKSFKSKIKEYKERKVICIDLNDFDM